MLMNLDMFQGEILLYLLNYVTHRFENLLAHKLGKWSFWVSSKMTEKVMTLTRHKLNGFETVTSFSRFRYYSARMQ